MRKISLKKLEISEIRILQDELINFITYKNAVLLPLKNTDGYFDAVLLIDIAQKIAFSFRGKIERTTKTTANLNLEPAEACVLLQCCCNYQTLRTGFEEFVMKKYAGLLHKELINLTQFKLNY